MFEIELARHADVIKDPHVLSTLHLTSARKKDDNEDDGLEPFVLDDQHKSASLECVDFDAVKLKCYPPTNPALCTPCSVDALVFERTGTYLIEFKFKKAAQENITRKIYDSVMLLIEHDGYSFDRARKEISYIVVSTGVEDRIHGPKRSLGRGYGYCKEPWKHYKKLDDHWKLGSLEGVIVKEAYGMHPSTFDYFAKEKRFV